MSKISATGSNLDAGRVVGAGELRMGVITQAPPITDVSLCFTYNTSRRVSSKFWHPPKLPPLYLKGSNDE